MAKGSQTVRGDYPALCHGCQKPVRVTVDNCSYQVVRGEKRSWHMTCKVPVPYVARLAG